MADLGQALAQLLLAGSRGFASKTLREQQLADEMRQEMAKRKAALEQIQARSAGNAEVAEIRAAMQEALQKMRGAQAMERVKTQQRGATRRERIGQRRTDRRARRLEEGRMDRAEMVEEGRGERARMVEEGRDRRAELRRETDLETARIRAGASKKQLSPGQWENFLRDRMVLLIEQRSGMDPESVIGTMPEIADAVRKQAFDELVKELGIDAIPDTEPLKGGRSALQDLDKLLSGG